MLFNVSEAMTFAIDVAKRTGALEVTADHLLLGCLRAVSRFGVAGIGPWAIDLEELDVNWVRKPEGRSTKVAYSEDAVKVLDQAAVISKASGDEVLDLTHLLAAYAGEQAGTMGELKKRYGITSALWRKAVSDLRSAGPDAASPTTETAPNPARERREYLTPEQAAEELGIHVQTMRGYIRNERLPAYRLAGERAIRILRTDLMKVLEPVGSGSQTA